MSYSRSEAAAEEIAYPGSNTLESMRAEQVNHPSHYGGGDNPYEVIKVAEAWGFDEDAYLFQVLKYTARAGKKSEDTELQDLEKAEFYLKRKIANLKRAIGDSPF